MGAVGGGGDDIEMMPVSVGGGGNLSVVDGFDWFLTTSQLPREAVMSEMDQWLKDYHAFSLRNKEAARKALNVRLVWEQPSMLRVPKSFDQIFQVRNQLPLLKASGTP